MWLINVETFKLREFISDDRPEYAILSHTWGPDEVTFSEMQALAPAMLKSGFRKIEYTCHEARRNGLFWAWVDTCCIDKSSSAELSEAINSMFVWYQQSKVCYVYLADMDDSHAQEGVRLEALAPCRWFTRGWCLQELLAPTSLVFFSRGWVKLEQGGAFISMLSSITGIQQKFLRHEEEIQKASVATRMSWAANRQCTRTEDISYCLMGIFDINMPLLYGEGKKAFRRLQEEIWKEVEDHTLLAWCVSEDDPRAWAMTGVFAESPHDFHLSRQLEPWTGAEPNRKPSTMTQRGIGLDAPTYELSLPFSPPKGLPPDSLVCEIKINCQDLDMFSGNRLSMLVVGSQHRFSRIATVGHMQMGWFGTRRENPGVPLNPPGVFIAPFTNTIGQYVEKSTESMVYIQKAVIGPPRYCYWNRLDTWQRLLLVNVDGLDIGESDIRVSDMTTLIQPLDSATIRDGWPRTTHSVYALDLGEFHHKTLEYCDSAEGAAIRTVAREDGPTSPTNPACFELLLSGNNISNSGCNSGSRLPSMILRCGLYIPNPWSLDTGGPNASTLWVCLDLKPLGGQYQESIMESRHVSTEALDTLSKDWRRKDRLTAWASKTVRPLETCPSNGEVAWTSCPLEEGTVHVLMKLVDTSGTGERPYPEVRAPMVTLEFRHDLMKPGWMDERNPWGLINIWKGCLQSSPLS